jgi:hypothetical protein
MAKTELIQALTRIAEGTSAPITLTLDAEIIAAGLGSDGRGGFGIGTALDDNNPAQKLWIHYYRFLKAFGAALEERHKRGTSAAAEQGSEDTPIRNSGWKQLWMECYKGGGVPKSPYKESFAKQISDSKGALPSYAAYVARICSQQYDSVGLTGRDEVPNRKQQLFGTDVRQARFLDNASVNDMAYKPVSDRSRWENEGGPMWTANGFMDALKLTLDLADAKSDAFIKSFYGDNRPGDQGVMIPVDYYALPSTAIGMPGPGRVPISRHAGKTAYQLADEMYQKMIAFMANYILVSCHDTDMHRGDLSRIAERADEIRAAQAQASRDAEALTALVVGEYQTAPYREQCYLLSRIFELTDYKRANIDGTIGKRLPYAPQSERRFSEWEPDAGDQDPILGYDGNAHIALDGPPFGFLNLLTQNPKLRNLWGISPAQLSALQPMIRLFKLQTHEDEDGNESLTEQEFNFNSYITDFSPLQRVAPLTPLKSDIELFQTREKRGVGAGIQSFNFTYDGHNPFAAKKSIKAELKIFANDFEELLRDRGGYRYIDLALKTGNTMKDTALRQAIEGECLPDDETNNLMDPNNIAAYEDELSKLRFRLKAVVGWAPPASGMTSVFFHQKRWKSLNTSDDLDYFDLIDNPQAEQPGIKEAIDVSYVTLNLTPTIHNFEIDDQGRVTLTINYLAYVEDFFDSPSFNIFTDIELAERAVMRKLQFQKIRSVCEDEKVEEFKEKEGESIKKDKLKSLQTILQKLYDNKMIHFARMSYDQLTTWRRRGPYAPGNMSSVWNPSTEETIRHRRQMRNAITRRSNGTNLSEEGADAQARYLTHVANNMDNTDLPFFYVGDLVDIILDGISEYLSQMPDQLSSIDEARLPTFITDCDIQFEVHKLRKFADQFKQFRAVLGPLEIINPANAAQSKEINFALIPISVKYFMEWLTDQLLKKEQTVYTLPNFLNDFFNLLVRNFLNDDTCFKYPIKQKIRNTQTVLSDYNTMGCDTLTANYIHMYEARMALQKAHPKETFAEYVPLHISKETFPSPIRPVLNISGPAPGRPTSLKPEDNYNYLVYHAGRVQPREHMNGEFMEDTENGIFHFQTGLSHGMVKTIGLTKTTSPGLPEVRFEQDGYDGLRQLRETFDAEIVTYALPQMFPGCYIYIDPRGWTPGNTRYFSDGNKTYDITEFGIGGYYMVIRSTTQFGIGQAETSITAKWVASLEQADDASRVSGDGSTAGGAAGDIEGASKCSTAINNWTHIPAQSTQGSADASGTPVDEPPIVPEGGGQVPTP